MGISRWFGRERFGTNGTADSGGLHRSLEGERSLRLGRDWLSFSRHRRFRGSPGGARGSRRLVFSFWPGIGLITAAAALLSGVPYVVRANQKDQPQVRADTSSAPTSFTADEPAVNANSSSGSSSAQLPAPNSGDGAGSGASSSTQQQSRSANVINSAQNNTEVRINNEVISVPSGGSVHRTVGADGGLNVQVEQQASGSSSSTTVVQSFTSSNGQATVDVSAQNAGGTTR